MNRACIFDIDGVIRVNNAVRNGGPYYTLDYSQVEYIAGIFSAHKLLQDAGYKIFWVTMQNCIKEQKITEQGVHDILIKMVADFKRKDIFIDDYQICQSPHETDESKSLYKSYAINKLAMVYNIYLSKSIGIGDRRHDIEAYDLSGIGKTIQALLPFGDKLHPNAYDSYKNGDSLKWLLYEVMSESGYGISIGLDSCRKVEKVWGNEYWIVNSKQGNYCSKILELKEGRKSSVHYHNTKHETFLVLSGIVHIGQSGLLHKCVAGDKVEVATRDPHWFQSMYGDSFILEVSTFHSDDDCVRLEESK
jgi:histidinol phosphatase-like enzyme/mannose-6-phosphate isomerase-like protein (cupin superfamily)